MSDDEARARTQEDDYTEGEQIENVHENERITNREINAQGWK